MYYIADRNSPGATAQSLSRTRVYIIHFEYK